MQIEWKTRLCQVGEKLGYFHAWEHYSKPLEASPLIGGAPAAAKCCGKKMPSLESIAYIIQKEVKEKIEND